MKAANLSFLYAGASISLIIRLSGVGLLFVANIVLARSIPQHDYGLFAYAVEVIALLAVLVALGLDQVAIRVVPDCLAAGDSERLHEFLITGFLTILLCSATATAALTVFRHVGTMPPGLGTEAVLLVGLSILALAALRLVQETMRASRRIALSQVVEQIGWPLLLLAVCLAAWLGRFALSVSAIIACQAIFFILSVTLLMALIVRGRSSRRALPVEEGPRQWLITGLPLALAAGLSILLNRGDILALGSAAGAAELAPYAAASRYAALLVLGQAAASVAGAALMRDAWRSGDREELQHAIDRGAGLSTLFALPIGLFLLTLPEFALAFYGPGYVKGAGVLRILTVAQLINAVTGPVALVVVVCDLGKEYTATVAASALLMAILLAFLIPGYGSIGAAVSTLVALSVLNVALAMLIWRRTGLRSWATPTAVTIALRDSAGLVLRR